MSQQLQIANRLNYPQKNILRRSEAFMRDYYQQARMIYSITELLSERLCLSTTRSHKRNGILGLLRKPKPAKSEEFDGFYSQDGLIYAESSNVFNQEPPRMMRLFQHMQQRGLELEPGACAIGPPPLASGRPHLPVRARSTRETFLAICSRKGQVGKIFRAMHEVDFLGRYIPEFGQLTCLVQHEFFHRYTADEHTLVCVEKLDMLVDTEEPKFAEYKKLFQKLENPERPLSRACSCTTRARRPTPASTPRPAPFSRKKSPAASNFPPSSARNSSCSWTITLSSP